MRPVKAIDGIIKKYSLKWDNLRPLWFPDDLCRPMIKFVKENNNGSSLIGGEIGVADGKNAVNIFKVLQIKKFYVIDPYVVYSQYDETPSKYIQSMYETMLRRLKDYQDRIVVIRRKSQDAIELVTDALDFLYIDGNHSYDNIKEDIELYYPKIKKGGVIGGHDFYGQCYGVPRAVFEFVDDHNLKMYGKELDWWVVKS